MSEHFQRVILDPNNNEGQPAASDYFGEDSTGNREGGFRSQDALAAAVSDERYRNDPAYRSAVQQLVSKTTEGVLTGPKPEPNNHAVEECEMTTDYITSMMADPRYHTSALYRREVMNRLAASQSPRALRHQSGADTGCHKVMLSNDASVDPMG